MLSMGFPAHCHGRQVCQITEVMHTFGEPCPQLGSYLSLDYHCREGGSLEYNPSLLLIFQPRITLSESSRRQAETSLAPVTDKPV